MIIELNHKNDKKNMICRDHSIISKDYLNLPSNLLNCLHFEAQLKVMESNDMHLNQASPDFNWNVNLEHVRPF